MLMDQIEQANQKSKRSRTIVILILLGVSLLLALVMLDILTVDFSRFKNLEEKTDEAVMELKPLRPPLAPNGSPAVRTIGEEPPAQQLPKQDQDPRDGLTGMSLPQAAPQTPEDSKLAEVSGARPLLTNTPKQPPTDAVQPIDLKQREDFKSALAKFDADFLGRIKATAFGAWNLEAQSSILGDRDSATSLFSQGDYIGALKTLQKSGGRAESELASFDGAYNREFKSASAFYQADDHEAAKWRIEAALRLQPDRAEAIDLKMKIDALPEILNLLKSIAVARVENNLAAEAENLKALLKVDPERKAAKNRLVEVEKELREQIYAGHIRDGLTHIDGKNLASARKALKAAQKVYNSRKETGYLAAQVARLDRDLKVEKLIGEARAAARADDWIKTEERYAEAAKLIPNKQEVVKGRELARKVIDMETEMAGHLAQPERLSSINVANAVEKVLQNAKSVQAFSPSLAEKRNKLSKVLDEYSEPVVIRVISDGETFISVRGVGRVGKVQQKEIKLRPGRYVIQGERQGYKTTSIEVIVEPGSFLSEVKVICNEPI